MISKPISVEAPFVDCPACKGMGLLNAEDGYYNPCDSCDGTGRYLPPVPKFYIRHDVEGKHLLRAMAILGLVLLGLVWAIKPWEWWQP